MKELKIARAEYLLSTTFMKIYEIASVLVYHSAQHFTRLFKESTGLTPLEYRKFGKE
jgi:transcriptional regulator GlxA family with amidase domain